MDAILASVAFWDFNMTEGDNFLAGFVLHSPTRYIVV
jgi:hypothetical protein